MIEPYDISFFYNWSSIDNITRGYYSHKRNNFFASTMYVEIKPHGFLWRKHYITYYYDEDGTCIKQIEPKQKSLWNARYNAERKFHKTFLPLICRNNSNDYSYNGKIVVDNNIRVKQLEEKILNCSVYDYKFYGILNNSLNIAFFENFGITFVELENLLKQSKNESYCHKFNRILNHYTYPELGLKEELQIFIEGIK